jgi:hypothetical protein
MTLQQGEHYRCSKCKAEVEVTKSGSPGEGGALYGEAVYGESTYGGEATSPLTCCTQEMTRID